MCHASPCRRSDPCISGFSLTANIWSSVFRTKNKKKKKIPLDNKVTVMYGRLSWCVSRCGNVKERIWSGERKLKMDVSLFFKRRFTAGWNTVALALARASGFPPAQQHEWVLFGIFSTVSHCLLHLAIICLDCWQSIMRWQRRIGSWNSLPFIPAAGGKKKVHRKCSVQQR